MRARSLLVMTENILNEFKKSNGIIFEGTDDISEDVQLTPNGNLIQPDEYYFYGESFDFETYFETENETDWSTYL